MLDGRVALHCGDCVEVLATLAECSLDSCVTDPPYHLTSIVKRFGAANSAPAKPMKSGDKAFSRLSTGFMGKRWDGGDIAFRPETWAAIFRVLKPGGYVLAFGGTRTYHRMACAIEDAGFEVRDMISWVYGSGFPKSHDVSKAIDRAAGVEREVVGQRKKLESYGPNDVYGDGPDHGGIQLITAPATDAAREWQGWGTALKPALEPICMARKPLSEGTVAANVLVHGTGALNIDGCRVDAPDGVPLFSSRGESRSVALGDGLNGSNLTGEIGKSRWPANVIHDGSEEVTAAFPDASGQQRDVLGTEDSKPGYSGGFGRSPFSAARNDSGSAARFFYQAKPDNGREGEASAERRYTDEGATDFAALPGMRRDAVPPSRLFYSSKADADDRLGSKHPTVKPVGLMQYLVRLVTPKGGIVLDPFSGTGTTGEAAWREGMRAVLIEREAEYQADIRRRMALCLAGPDERARESIKAKTKDKPIDAGPLFS